MGAGGDCERESNLVLSARCWSRNCGSFVAVGLEVGSNEGAHAVVTKDLPAWSVAVGIPAKVVKERKGNDPVVSA